jgi:hypothetical protein
LPCLAGGARGAEPVDLKLALASDVSRSIDDDEFALQRQGYAAAFRDPRVVASAGAFVLAVEGFDSFAEAIAEKLVLEIAQAPEPSRAMFAAGR